MTSKLFILLIVVLGIGSPRSAIADNTASRQAIETAFLYNFALFTQWPDITASHSFNICVLGNSNPLGESLEQLNGKLIENLPVRTQIVRSPGEASHCHILFVPSSWHHLMPTVASALRDTSTLIISEANNYNPNEVMIILGEENGRINFQINHTATKRAGLNVSSKLLRLARKVY